MIFKKPVLFLLFMTYGLFNLNAQIEKGTLLVGSKSDISASSGMTTTTGALDYWQTHIYVNSEKFTNLALNPIIGYFIANNLVIGLVIPVKYQSYNKTEKAYSVMGKPFIKLYIGNGFVKPYAQVAAGFGILNSDNLYTQFGYDYSVGMGIALNERFVIDIGMGFASLKYNEVVNQYDIPKTQKLTDLGLDLGLVVLL
ncbi:hypothetical protein ACE1ET_04355 [Saccharicrinis sp. FJH62]|uniref:hypothetical protein n=1 Tax=Saccharicrinis sp. FJH62 TaxID=3344657 RepID=UPI0035D4548D